MALKAFLALAFLCGVRVGAAACTNDPYARELAETGDAFRLVSVLKEREVNARGSDAGFTCARSLLRLYLQHAEYDLADGWLSRMTRLYPQVASVAPSHRLRAEMAYLFGNEAEVRRRLAEGPAPPGADALLTFAATAATPLQPPPVTCTSQPCQQLRAVLARSPGRKRPGLALALGVVPGLGQIYAGRVAAGLGSFVLHALVGGVTAYGLHRREYALAALTGSVGTALYFGNLYAGWEAARRENEARAARLAGEIRGIPLPLALYRLAD